MKRCPAGWRYSLDERADLLILDHAHQLGVTAHKDKSFTVKGVMQTFFVADAARLAALSTARDRRRRQQSIMRSYARVKPALISPGAQEQHVFIVGGMKYEVLLQRQEDGCRLAVVRAVKLSKLPPGRVLLPYDEQYSELHRQLAKSEEALRNMRELALAAHGEAKN